MLGRRASEGMARYRIALRVEWSHGGEPILPLAPLRSSRQIDGSWVLEFEVDAPTFDQAAGRLWGEAAACGLEVRGVTPLQPQV